MKGFSGINNLADSSSTEEGKNKLEDFVISFEKCPTMPAIWYSEDAGEAWEWGKYILVLQKHPMTITEGMQAMVNHLPVKSLKAKDDGLRYLFSLSIFYKQGQNPAGIDSSRPAEVLTIEQADIGIFYKLIGKPIPEDLDCDADGWDSPTFCSFVPNKHLNFHPLHDTPTRENVKKCFFEYLGKKIPGQPIYIGTMADAQRLKNCNKNTSKHGSTENTTPRSKKRCAGVVWIIVVLIIIFGGYLFFTSDTGEWMQAVNTHNADAYRTYLRNNPTGNHRNDAAEKIKRFMDVSFTNLSKPYRPDEVMHFLKAYPEYVLTDMDKTFFENAQQENTLDHFRNYLRVFPDGTFVNEVKEKIANIENKLWQEHQYSRDEQKLHNLAEKIQDQTIMKKIKQRIEELYKDFSFVAQKNTKDAYQRFMELNPTSPNIELAKKRIIDIEVAEIAASEHGDFTSSSPIFYGHGTTATIEIENQTSYTITVRYSGPDSQIMEIPAHGKHTISIVTGAYKIAVSTKQGNVRPFYGTNNIQAGRYTESFYIQSTPTYRRQY